MRCAVSFYTVVVLSVAVGVLAIYIIWYTQNDDDCDSGNGFRCIADGRCITSKQSCDGKKDCSDNSDESLLFCSDLSTTKELFDVLFQCGRSGNKTVNFLKETNNESLEVAGSNISSPSDNETFLEIDNSSSILAIPKINTAPEVIVDKKPEECSFLWLPGSPPAGVQCVGEGDKDKPPFTWSSIPWSQFDEHVRTITIDSSAVNTSQLLGQNENGTIVEFSLMRRLYIDNNYIESVGDFAFCHMEAVCFFSLKGNSIRNLSSSAFCPLDQLIILKMSENRLHLEGFVFKNMDILKILYLDINEIEVVHNYTFAELANLKMLNLSHNKIHYVEQGAFTHNKLLIEIDLTGNLLTQLDPALFLAQRYLTKLYISHNPFEHLSADLFLPLTDLLSLGLEGLDISQINTTLFTHLPYLDLVYFKKFSYCSRFVPKARRCYPNSDGLSSTTNLLIGKSRIAVWFISIITLIGNISVLANRWGRRQGARSEIRKTLEVFVNNLACADLLMGIYLIVVAGKDFEFRGQYSVKAYEWTKSWLCSGIGILAMISSEVSLITLTIMSLERYLTIAAPYSRSRNLNQTLAWASMFVIWVFAGVLAIAPAIQWMDTMSFYGSTGLCFPLHLDDRIAIGWQYTSFVFIGVNSCCLILITISYSMLYYSVRQTQAAAAGPPSSTDLDLAFRFFLMVATDVMCWAPIILLKAVVLFGYELDKETIGWTVIYILPINSAVNPILYTFSTNDVRGAIASYFRTVLQRLEMRLSSSNYNDANVELSNQMNGNRGGQEQRMTATEDTELTHSSCPIVAEGKMVSNALIKPSRGRGGKGDALREKICLSPSPTLPIKRTLQKQQKQVGSPNDDTEISVIST